MPVSNDHLASRAILDIRKHTNMVTNVATGTAIHQEGALAIRIVHRFEQKSKVAVVVEKVDVLNVSPEAVVVTFSARLFHFGHVYWRVGIRLHSIHSHEALPRRLGSEVKLKLGLKVASIYFGCRGRQLSWLSSISQNCTSF
jgi:hypothetical protein